MNEQAAPTQDALLARALAALDAEGIDQAVTVARSGAEPLEAGRAFSDMSKMLYRNRKDVTGMIAIGEAGIAFCLQEAERATEPASATELRKLARAIAYNTATNCWPGWGDDGIRIEPHHLQAGLALAGTCRDLVEALQLGPRPLGGAYWLIGALKLAAGEPLHALSDFQHAQQVFAAGGLKPFELMARGYAALAQKADPASAAVGAQELASALQALRDEGSKDSLFFAEQIVIAERILLAQ